MLKIRTRDKVAALGVGIAAMMFYFDDRYLLGPNCSPDTGYAQVSQNMKGRRFWLQQLAQVDAELRRQLDEINSLQHIEQVSVDAYGQAQQLRATFYANAPELRPTPAQVYAQQLRDTADAVERNANLSRRAAEANQNAQSAAMCRAKIQAQFDMNAADLAARPNNEQ
jgi:hypothetical protein